MNDIHPTYNIPCKSDSYTSLESSRLYSSDFGECYPPPSDSQVYPRLIPVYNGKVLDIGTEFIHASLSGISIKHHYGKCMKEPEADKDEDDIALFGDNGAEGFDYDWYTVEKESSVSMKNTTKYSPEFSGSSTSTRSYNFRESTHEGQPLCTMPMINHRNSFWNIHRPELCKLTWGQKYVGASTVTEHLHEHLFQHGDLCSGFHTAEDRAFMLKKELDEYVRLKVLQESRKLPPDEPLFDFRAQPKKSKQWVTKCRFPTLPEIKMVINDNDRFLELSDDDEEEERKIRRSKEEFCLTIGRHVRKPPVLQEEIVVPEEMITPQLSYYGEEEVGGVFCYNWLLYPAEESYEVESERKAESVSVSTSDLEPSVEPCPPLMMDEFCRAAGKVDFSDLRCDPDF